MHRGYVCLWRKITETGWSDKPNVLSLAIHLLLLANHQPKKTIFNNSEMVINRGQCITGLFKLSMLTGLTTQKIRTSLKILKKFNFLTIKSTNKFSVITICNYSKYQISKKQNNKQTNKQITNKQQTNNKQITTSKECNNEKECNKEKNKFLECIYLTKEETHKLKEKLNSRFSLALDLLNNYKLASGKKYKSDYHAILQWVIPKIEKEYPDLEQKTQKKQEQYHQYQQVIPDNHNPELTRQEAKNAVNFLKKKGIL